MQGTEIRRKCLNNKNNKIKNQYKKSSQMKKSVLFTVMIAGFFFNAQAHAARALDLSGNEYNVYILCSEDLGDFCDQGRIKKDAFIYNGNDFSITSFQGGIDGLLSGGEFRSGGLTFDASYDGFNDADEYEFDIKGITILDTILFGTMDITYTEFDFLNPNPIAGKAFFLGIKNRPPPASVQYKIFRAFPAGRFFYWPATLRHAIL
jgi:hypothetical protein